MKDASIALGTYTTYAYPTAIVKQEWTDNTYVHISGATSASTYYHTPPSPPLSPLTTYVRVRRCTTEKADDIYKYIIKEARLVGVCGVSTQSSFPTSATGGVYGTYSGLTCGAGTWTVSETFSYSTTAAKNCVTKSGKFYTYKTVFADETVTKVGVDLDVLNPITCAAPYWQKTPLTGVCTEVTVLGSQFGNVKFLPLAAGDLATGGMSASKSVMYIKFANGDTTCATTVSMAWGGVYGTTGCADISGPPTENWKVRHSLHATRASSTFSCSPLLIRLLFSHHSSARTRPAPLTPCSRRRRSSASALLAPSSRQPRSSRKRCAQRPPRVDDPSLLFHQHHHLVETINVFQGSCPRVVHKKKAVSSACAAAPLPRAHTRSPLRRTIFEEF